MVGFGETMLDAVGWAQSTEGMREPVAARLACIGELDAVLSVRIVWMR
jgi:hypothetical protein